MIGNVAYNKSEIHTNDFKYKDKNLKENFASFLNSKVNRPDQIMHLKPPTTMRAQLNKTSDHGKHLVEEISNISKYKVEQENVFLYNNSNMIGGTFNIVF